MSTPEEIGKIVLTFLYFRDQLKIYHWQTSSYARHKSIDDLLEVLSLKIDEFVEVIQGSRGFRLKIPKEKSGLKYGNDNDSSTGELLRNMRYWVSLNLKGMLKEEDVGLQNIIDDIVAIVNRFIYLFSLG